MDYESALWEIVQATVVANVSGVAIGDANRSRTDGQRCRLCNLKHKRNGIFHLTVEFFTRSTFSFQATLEQDGNALTSLLVDATHEFDIDKKLFPPLPAIKDRGNGT